MATVPCACWLQECSIYGVTLAVALASLVTGRAPREDVSFFGDVFVDGQVRSQQPRGVVSGTHRTALVGKLPHQGPSAAHHIDLTVIP